jgi:hypothetical protein
VALLSDCSRNRHPIRARRRISKKDEVYRRQIWMVCRESYTRRRFLFVRTPDFGAPFEVVESLKCWFRLRAS